MLTVLELLSFCCDRKKYDKVNFTVISVSHGHYHKKEAVSGYFHTPHTNTVILKEVMNHGEVSASFPVCGLEEKLRKVRLDAYLL